VITESEICDMYVVVKSLTDRFDGVTVEEL
jgi:hypothetical protein